MGGEGRQKREVWRGLRPAVALRAGAGAAVAVTVGRHASIWGPKTQLWAGVRAHGAPRGPMRGAGAVAREARGIRTRATSTFEVVVIKHGHQGGGGAQLAAELQLLHPPSQDVWHGAAEVIGWFNNCAGDTAKGQNYNAMYCLKTISIYYRCEYTSLSLNTSKAHYAIPDEIASVDYRNKPLPAVSVNVINTYRNGKWICR